MLTPFSDRHETSKRTTIYEVAVVAFMTKALVRLCRELGEQGRQRRTGRPATGEDVAAMARLVADAFLVDLREPVRRWLGTYLRDRRGAPWAMDDHLIASASGR